MINNAKECISGHAQQTQNICITFVQRPPNVFDVGPALYKCYTNVLCPLGVCITTSKIMVAKSLVRSRTFYKVLGTALVWVIVVKVLFKTCVYWERFHLKIISGPVIK